MNLKSFGDSYIFGSELTDDTTLYITHSKLTWPAMLAKKLSYNYECFARPGAGNLHILEQILNQIEISNKSDLFVIGWSYLTRFDYINKNADPEKPWFNWSSCMPSSRMSDVDKIYFKELHSIYRDILTSLTYIKLVIDSLEQREIKFIMTCADESLLSQLKNPTPGLLYLQNYIKSYITQFNNNSFHVWSSKNKYQFGPGGHPLEDAHLAGADYMFNVYKNNYL
jgi:hypothetical protein